MGFHRDGLPSRDSTREERVLPRDGINENDVVKRRCNALANKSINVKASGRQHERVHD